MKKKHYIEFSISALVAVGVFLIVDSQLFIHPMSPTNWRGAHNFLGRWIGTPHLRLAELSAGCALVLLFAALGVTAFISKSNSKEPNKTPQATSL